MSERRGPGVRDAGELEHRRDVGVARLALDPVGHVEDESRRLPGVWIRRGELLERIQQRLISFEEGREMSTRLERLDDLRDRAAAVFLSARRAEVVDHTV